MTSPETLDTKVVVNEIIFPLVTHTTDSDARFDSYGIFKLGQGAENFLDILDIPTDDQGLKVEDPSILAKLLYGFRRPLNQLSNAYSYTQFW
jgi:hypothetical protein